MSKLMKPLFIDGMYNREGKRIRANYLKTITCGDISYPLWVNDGKPDREYIKIENDKYYLYIQVDDWLIMTGYTEHGLEQKTGQDQLNNKWYGGDFKAREEYFNENFYKGRNYDEYSNLVKAHIVKEEAFINEFGKDEIFQVQTIQKFVGKCIENYIEARDFNGKFADFIGATFLGELDRCCEIASVLRKERQEKEQKRKKEIAEQKAKEAKEKEQAEQLLMEETERMFVNGGTIKGGDIIVKLADKYSVNIPIRTRGWILNTLCESTITEDGGVSYRYWKSKGATGSQKVYEVLYNIRRAIKTA